MLTREQSQALTERVLKLGKADETQVTIDSSDEKNIRFADNRITTSGGVGDTSLRVYSAFGRRHAVTTTNDLSDEGIERVVRLSETLARLAPENPEKMPLLGPQTYAEVDGYFAATSSVSADARARAAATVLGGARKAGDITAAGLLVTGARSVSVGNRNGLFGYRRSTAADFTTTVRTNDGTGSGWAGANHPDWAKVNVDAASAAAIAKARLSRNPTPIEPGRYTVVLEPRATGDLVALMAGSLDARSADEGRSAFSKPGGGSRIGEKIMDERVSFISDPAHPLILGSHFDGEGAPLGRQVWVENGVLRNMAYSRYWAQKQGRQATGSPDSLIMTGGTGTLADVIASTERGVLVTRFWYIRGVNARTLLFTGLTRDGTFMIENGKITRPVRNMRFNESPLFMLAKLEAIGAPVRLPGDNGLVMPPIRVRDFNFASVSDAV